MLINHIPLRLDTVPGDCAHYMPHNRIEDCVKLLVQLSGFHRSLLRAHHRVVYDAQATGL